jgi:hypothetical protein
MILLADFGDALGEGLKHGFVAMVWIIIVFGLLIGVPLMGDKLRKKK